MAEIVGGVAAGLELGKIALELKQICSSVKHAPENLEQLLEELESLEEVLQTLADQEAVISAYASPDVARKCRQRCERGVTSLKPVCIELSNGIRQSRLRGAFKSILKEDALERARQGIERAKSNFILAQLATMNAMSTFNIQQHSSTQTLIVSSSAHVSSLIEDIRRAPQMARSTAVSNCSSSNPTQQGAILAVTGRTDNGVCRPWTNARTRRLMRLQSRLLGKGLEFIQQQSYGAWTYGFKIYNIRPRNSSVFRYAEQGNIVTLQQLFTTNQASAYDRDEFGWTLLDFASVGSQAQTIRFLRQQGADPNEETRHLPLWPIDHAANKAEILDAIYALTEGASLDDITGDLLVVVSIAQYLYPTLVPNLLQMFSPPWQTLEFHTRMSAAYGACSAKRHPSTFWHCLAQPQLDASCLVLKNADDDETSRYESLVQCLASVLGKFWQHDSSCDDLHGWRSLFQSAVSLGGLQVSFEHDCHSPMLAYLQFSDGVFDGSPADLSSKRLTHRLGQWAEEVLRAGQDLEEYGKWEYQFSLKRGYKARFRKDYSPSCLGGQPQSIHIVNFTYGASPRDWRIWMSTSHDEHTGEFWESLQEEETKIQIPGAWSDTIAVDYSSGYRHSRWMRSRRRRRRLLRYLNMPLGQENEVFGPGWEANLVVEFEKEEKAKRDKFFRDAGICPPY